tara:strand:+ start:4099 stop:5463 length:1365 start_codon:yes stop_codon:yes gene_type:complete
MKTNLLVLINCLLWINLNAQFSSEQIITTNLDDPNFIFSADLDGDGDYDVISSSVQDHKLVWFENIDGLGSFDNEKIINDTLLTATSTTAADIDGDGDLDILVSYGLSHMLVWFENTDGLGNFGAQRVITTDVYGFYSIDTADFDGDGDLDVITTTYQKVEWFENVDGLGNFGPPNNIFTEDYTRKVKSVDIDGDGDMDALVSYNYPLDGKITWYENADGLGTFGPQQIIFTNILVIKSIFASDLDGDGDLDVLSASRNDNIIAWYENTNGLGSFGVQQIISDTALYAFSVHAADIDNDGDQDIFTARGDDYISWYENTNGQGNFGSEQIISENADGAVAVFAADINGDGLVDAISASSWDDKVAWYSNGVLGLENNKLTEISLYPIPFNNILSIENSNHLDITRISIFDSQGRLIFKETQSISEIDMSHFPAGIFFVTIESENSRLTKKVIKY